MCVKDPGLSTIQLYTITDHPSSHTHTTERVFCTYRQLIYRKMELGSYFRSLSPPCPTELPKGARGARGERNPGRSKPNVQRGWPARLSGHASASAVKWIPLGSSAAVDPPEFYRCGLANPPPKRIKVHAVRGASPIPADQHLERADRLSGGPVLGTQSGRGRGCTRWRRGAGAGPGTDAGVGAGDRGRAAPSSRPSSFVLQGFSGKPTWP